MSTNHTITGPVAPAPREIILNLNQLTALLAQSADWRTRAPEVLRPFIQTTLQGAEKRGQIQEELEVIHAELQRLGGEIPKMETAVNGGAPYRPRDPGPVLPKGPLALGSAVACVAALAVLEASTAANIYGMCVQFLPSKLTAALAATPVLAVPFCVKLLPQASPRSRIGIAVVSLLASLAFVTALCRMVQIADIGAFGGVLALQILADVLGLVCTSAVLAKITTPSPTEALRQELADSEKRSDELKGRAVRLKVDLDQLEKVEEAMFQIALLMVEAEAAANDAEAAFIRGKRERSQAVLAGVRAAGRN